MTDEVGEENVATELVVVVEWVGYILRQRCCNSIVRRSEERVTRLLICSTRMTTNEQSFHQKYSLSNSHNYDYPEDRIHLAVHCRVHRTTSRDTRGCKWCLGVSSERN